MADDNTCNTLVQNGACSVSASSTLRNFVTERCALACGFCTPGTASTSVTKAAAATTNNRGTIHVTSREMSVNVNFITGSEDK